jgi:7-carboxy-7-deazaguanine synthase
MTPKLRITEIFLSIQGETSTVGLPTVFVRLTGCPLRCQYCDTAYAFQGGESMDISTILETVANYGVPRVTVTGGEPLAQKPCLALLTQLCDKNHEVSLETSGALDVSGVDPRVVKIIDIKTPGSKENHRNYLDNLNYLLPQDQIKFVICDRNDYEWSRELLSTTELHHRCHILFSPSYTELHPKDLAEWILADKLPVRLQIQLHKYLWGDTPGK